MDKSDEYFKFIESGGLSLPKFCVFCGQNPRSKTKEHVIPSWLISLTGKPGRKVNFGYKWFSRQGGQREFSFDRFTFPACDKCNSDFSVLENENKRIVSNMLMKRTVSASDIDLFLDWLDKVRLGIWLGYLTLNKITAYIRPKYYIKSRMRKSDRFLAIAIMENVGNGITFCGVDTLLGLHMPSCFGLRINDLFLINASTDLLVSRSLGLPSINRSTLRYISGNIAIELVGGTKRITRPFLGTPIPKYCTKFAQAIR